MRNVGLWMMDDEFWMLNYEFVAAEQSFAMMGKACALRLLLLIYFF